MPERVKKTAHSSNNKSSIEELIYRPKAKEAKEYVLKRRGEEHKSLGCTVLVKKLR